MVTSGYENRTERDRKCDPKAPCRPPTCEPRNETKIRDSEYNRGDDIGEEVNAEGQPRTRD